MRRKKHDYSTQPVYEEYESKCIEKVQSLYIFRFDQKGEPTVMLGPHCNNI